MKEFLMNFKRWLILSRAGDVCEVRFVFTSLEAALAAKTLLKDELSFDYGPLPKGDVTLIGFKLRFFYKREQEGEV